MKILPCHLEAWVAALLLGMHCGVVKAQPGSFFAMEGHSDVGKPSYEGSVETGAGKGAFTVIGGGHNMWFTNDAFHFVWARCSGDLELSAAIEWLTTSGDPHRKACLMLRQDLEPGSPYIDVAVHGDGLTSLQWRETAGGLTHEIQSNQKQPSPVGIGRQGDSCYLLQPGAEASGLGMGGPFKRIQLRDPIYVGLGVCAHNDAALAKASFKDVRLAARKADSAGQVLHSTLETIPIASGDRRVVYTTRGHIEAPNWSRDGAFLLFNSRGRIFRIPVGGGTPQAIDSGFATNCNNDHGLSPDGKELVISDQTRTGKSLIYVLPASGGQPRQVTTLGPSYWHGWSPDGSTMAYCAERGGEFDIYTIPVAGGEERRLTTAKGLDDGPEYSPDGKFIYFNSNRTGKMHIWRMRPDGSEQERLTSDDHNNWFPHPSPDGKWIVFLSYEADVEGHPANKPVRLRLMPAAGGTVQELARLFGGQGTINVPSWSPDSRQLAFVSYELLAP